LFVLDAPFGRFARVGSRLNLNGARVATTHPCSPSISTEMMANRG
jgi:hypothetical protein